MKNFPYGFSFLGIDFSLCTAPIPSKPLSLDETASLVVDNHGIPYFTQQIRCKRLQEETTFVPLNIGETVPRGAVIVAELPNSD
ncbi:MAG: hypothetical protein FJZ56_07650 [Chlamydiae bacterium]|nr:hypothetical protein [Chlamydiota bacterium]